MVTCLDLPLHCMNMMDINLQMLYEKRPCANFWSQERFLRNPDCKDQVPIRSVHALLVDHGERTLKHELFRSYQVLASHLHFGSIQIPHGNGSLTCTCNVEH